MIEHEPEHEILPILPASHRDLALQRLCLMDCASYFLVEKGAFPVGQPLAIDLRAMKNLSKASDLFKAGFLKVLNVLIEELGELLDLSLREDAGAHRASVPALQTIAGWC